MDTRRLRFRVGLLLVVILAVVGLYAVRLYKLQMVSAGDNERWASSPSWPPSSS